MVLYIQIESVRELCLPVACFFVRVLACSLEHCELSERTTVDTILWTVDSALHANTKTTHD